MNKHTYIKKKMTRRRRRKKEVDRRKNRSLNENYMDYGNDCYSIDTLAVMHSKNIATEKKRL